MERNHPQAVVPAGELYFLRHPAAVDTFAGYGLPMRRGRTDHLTGLLMVDRPTPVDPQWLAGIEEIFGEYALVPMAASGERGIACQMHLDWRSRSLLEQRDDPLSAEIAHSLAPLLENPPRPALALQWDEQHRLWTSRPWIGLPWEFQQAFDRTGYGCLATEVEETVRFVTHASDEDIQGFSGAPVLCDWELIEMPSAPLIRFRALILDDLLAPFGLENFLNIDDPGQARCLQLLAGQDFLSFDFFGEDYEYVGSTYLDHDEDTRGGLEGLVARAEAYWSSLPKQEQDFDRAKAEFLHRYPV